MAGQIGSLLGRTPRTVGLCCSRQRGMKPVLPGRGQLEFMHMLRSVHMIIMFLRFSSSALRLCMVLESCLFMRLYGKAEMERHWEVEFLFSYPLEIVAGRIRGRFCPIIPCSALRWQLQSNLYIAVCDCMVFWQQVTEQQLQPSAWEELPELSRSGGIKSTFSLLALYNNRELVS